MSAPDNDGSHALTLAIFDLDHTLLAGDSDYLWGRFLVEHGIVDGHAYDAANDRFYRDYQEGSLDIDAFLAFALRPLAENDPADLHRWRNAFIDQHIHPIVPPAAQALVERHREAGHTLMIITATNRFVTEPIAALFGVEHLLATTPEWRNGRYTGAVTGTPTFRDGKVHVLRDWLIEHGESLDGSYCYSDSHNDLPLLTAVTHPVAVDPDPPLRRTALERGWPVISLRDRVVPEPMPPLHERDG